MAFNQLRHQWRRGRGAAGILVPVVPDSYWVNLDDLLHYTAQLPGFGSSTPDTTVTSPTRSTNLWYDKVNGSDSNSGTAWNQAKRTCPYIGGTATPGDTELHFRPGDDYPLNYPTTQTRGLWLPNANSSVSTFDPNTGATITGFPSPFTELLARRRPLDADRTAKYVTLTGNTPTIAPFSTNAPAGINISGAGCVVRGVWARGHAWGAQVNASNVTVEDCYLQDIIRKTDWSSSGSSIMSYGGAGVRIDSAAATNFRIARVTVDNIGEDAWWINGSGLMPTGFYASDCATRHYTAGQVINNQHSDFMQLGNLVAGTTFRRQIGDHMTQLHPMAAWNADGSDAPIGAGIQTTGDNSSTTVATGAIFEDIALISNHNIANMARASAFKFKHMVGVMKRHNRFLDANGSTATVTCIGMNMNGTSCTSEACLFAYMNPHFAGDVAFSGAANVGTSNWIILPNG